MFKNLDHINIIVSDVAEAKEFFVDLGFKIDDEADLQGEWISSVVGLKSVEARYVKLSLPGSSTGGLIHRSSAMSESYLSRSILP